MEPREITLRTAGEEVKQDTHFEIDDGVNGIRHFILRGDREYVEVTKPPVTPVRTDQTRKYTVKDVASFVSYVNQHGDAQAGIIAFAHEGVTMFFSERNREEFVRLPWELSFEYCTLFGGSAGARVYKQKDFVKTLEMFPDQIADLHLILPHLSLIRMDKKVTFESDIDPRNHTFIFQERGGDQTALIPKELVITIPYFERSANPVTIRAELEIVMPKSADEKPLLTLTDYRRVQTKLQALDLEVEQIRRELPGWMFVFGSLT